MGPVQSISCSWACAHPTNVSKCGHSLLSGYTGFLVCEHESRVNFYNSIKVCMGWDGIDTLIARPQAQGTQEDVLNTMRGGGPHALPAHHPTLLSTAAPEPRPARPLAPGPALEWPSYLSPWAAGLRGPRHPGQHRQRPRQSVSEHLGEELSLRPAGDSPALGAWVVIPYLPASLCSSLVRTRPPAWSSEPWKNTMWPSPWSGTISSSKSFLGTGVSKDSLEPGLRGSWQADQGGSGTE